MTRSQPYSEAQALDIALDDFQIIQAQGGDTQAFALLFSRWQPRFLRLALRLTGNREDAQDVVQDAAISLSKSLHKLDDPRRFSAFCYTIIRRRAADLIKRNIKTREIGDSAAWMISGSQDNSDAALAMRQALTQMDPTARLMLTLFYCDGFTGVEMAAALGVPLGTVKSRLFKARARLRQIYLNPPEGDDHEHTKTI